MMTIQAPEVIAQDIKILTWALQEHLGQGTPFVVKLGEAYRSNQHAAYVCRHLVASGLKYKGIHVYSRGRFILLVFGGLEVHNSQ